MHFACREWVDLPFGVEEQRVLAYYGGQFFVRLCVDDENVPLMAYQVVGDFDRFVFLQTVKVIEVCRKQFGPDFDADLLHFGNYQKLHLTSLRLFG